MSHPLFSESSGISAIGSTALGLMYLPAPLLTCLTTLAVRTETMYDVRPHHHRHRAHRRIFL